ncbi:hypothetical protein BD324DRAFT_200109 [Kockovaella imperatae]|uniref:Uncharacterized protein n=1 Tax=Kockovaella imperatae TaxID=4999 RepID=A0A1Y1U6Y0_9TREE|nr:hypothetical protein BD324DRAFT_200109 [Kockovaella imperatae]ORX33799.1 hypothetical protein BD324DRAFT_200109 [Kockovaella imperatae]
MYPITNLPQSLHGSCGTWFNLNYEYEGPQNVVQMTTTPNSTIQVNFTLPHQASPPYNISMVYVTPNAIVCSWPFNTTGLSSSNTTSNNYFNYTVAPVAMLGSGYIGEAGQSFYFTIVGNMTYGLEPFYTVSANYTIVNATSDGGSHSGGAGLRASETPFTLATSLLLVWFLALFKSF